MEPIALYIHWPFCLAKCPYCDFNSHVRERPDGTRFRRALRAELAWEAIRLGKRRLTSIFFGGGTPSLMAPESVAELIADACKAFEPASDLETTLEANPTSVEAGRLAEFRAAGINRLSLGVQSLDPEALTVLGREHSAAQAIDALHLARRVFPQLSFDLIYGRPHQTAASWIAELQQALELAADHLSLYQLTIEPGTAFETLHRSGALVLPDEDTKARLYDITGEQVLRFGMTAYEVSNYARYGAQGRHNLSYWRYDSYIGIGPGAHGRLRFGDQLIATRRHRLPERWADLVESQGHGIKSQALLTTTERAREMLIMGLRLTEGVDAARFHARTGLTLDDALDPDGLSMALEAGYVERTVDRVMATSRGRLVLDSLLAAIVL